ncbi:MAG: DUF2911 domain-containing protein [Candidatus Kapabacteria bacterium]|jgi:hypothetical protein|nr:DUF2911 domain-containing protein [Candidatus Kapabacteria bacterium]
MTPRTFRFAQGALSLVALLAFVASTTFAQQVRFPSPSSGAVVKQTLGITDVTVTYSRPGVKGREVWGKLVPFNELWRTGANAATVLEVSDEVMIEGQKLPAGKYSLFTVPAQTGEWTLVINKNPNLGGTAGYKQEEDVFRAKVKAQMMPVSREWLEFSFEDLSDTAANLVLYWERLRLPIKMTVNTADLAFGKARTAVANGLGANIGFANYALQTGTNLDEAMKMIDASIAVQETYRNHVIKARLLEKSGKKADAVKFLEKGVTMGKAMKNAPFDLADNEKLLATWKSMK